MTITEITIFDLKKATTNEELAKDATHKKCLETVKAAKGFQNVIWSVLDDNPKALAWLVGECLFRLLRRLLCYSSSSKLSTDSPYPLALPCIAFLSILVHSPRSRPYITLVHVYARDLCSLWS